MRKLLANIRIVPVLLGLSLLGAALPSTSQAALVTLTHANAVVNMDDTFGIYDWTINGQDQLFLEWFYYRAGAMPNEAPLDGATLVSSVQVSPNRWDGAYSDGATWLVNVALTLTGSLTGDFISDLAETISITNIGNQNLQFVFFEYTDFDLGGTIVDNSVTLDSVPIPGKSAAVVSQADAGVIATTTILSPPGLSHYELATFPTIISKLTDGVVDNLASLFPPPGNSDVLLGPADLTWAVQWTLDLAPGATFIISKDKLIAVPEPTSLALVGMGVVGAVGYGWRRRLQKSRSDS